MQKILSVCNFFKPLEETSETSPAESEFEQWSWVVGAGVGQVVSVIVNTELKVNSSYLK